jgi:thymidylate kinase
MFATPARRWRRPRALAAGGWTVGIAAPRPDGLAAASRRVSAFHAVPRPEDGAGAFAAGLRDAVAAGRYEVVFASSDVDVLALSVIRKELDATVPYPPHAALRRALDKLALTAAAERAGLRVPATAAGATDLPAMPVVVKERIHGDLAEGGPAETTGTDIVGDPDAVRARLAALAAAGGAGLVQEVVHGRLVALTVLCDRGQRVVARVQQEALRIWPGDAGMSARARTVVVDEELSAGVERLLGGPRLVRVGRAAVPDPAGGRAAARRPQPPLLRFAGAGRRRRRQPPQPLGAAGHRPARAAACRRVARRALPVAGGGPAARAGAAREGQGRRRRAGVPAMGHRRAALDLGAGRSPAVRASGRGPRAGAPVVRAHEIVDRALRGPAVVVGSLPPAGRDLDLLLADAGDAVRVEEALRAAGFTALGDGWLRFAHRTAELVEFVTSEDLRLGPHVPALLVADAILLDGARRLARPAPAHAVLLLARQTAMAGGLPTKRRRRLEAALAEDPAAWSRAVEEAGAWGAGAELQRLAELARRPAGDAGRARRGLLPSGVRARLGAARDRLRGRRRGAVVALSGLDGSGKSTQAAALADALDRLGHAVAVEWTRLGGERSWARMPASARATALTVEHLWIRWRRLGGFLARDYVVVSDRYTLDAIVALRALTGARHRAPLRRALLRRLARRPDAAFLLDVAPQTAWERKGEQGPVPLRRQRDLYLAEHRALGVELLDGERPADELAAHIAWRVWQALG